MDALSNRNHHECWTCTIYRSSFRVVLAYLWSGVDIGNIYSPEASIILLASSTAYLPAVNLVFLSLWKALGASTLLLQPHKGRLKCGLHHKTPALINLYTLLSDVQRNAGELREDVREVLRGRLHHNQPVHSQMALSNGRVDAIAR